MITKSDDAVMCRHSVNCCDLTPDMHGIFIVVVVALSTIVIQEHMLALSGENLIIMEDRRIRSVPARLCNVPGPDGHLRK